MLAKAPEKYYKTWSAFPEFFLFYLSQHMKLGTRAVHYVGTWIAWLALPLAIYDAATGAWLGNPLCWLYIPAGLVYMYGTAFLSHWLIEKNQPATFVYPLLSVGGDLRMFWLMTIRQNKGHVEEVRRRLADGWLADREALWPPELATQRRATAHRSPTSLPA